MLLLKLILLPIRLVIFFFALPAKIFMFMIVLGAGAIVLLIVWIFFKVAVVG